MRKQSLALATGLFSANLCLAELQITGVFDGPLTGGLPKGVELYSDNAIADLSLYGLGSANNGGGSDGEEFTFPSVALAAGQYVYVASESQGFTAFLGFAPDFVSNALSINGVDAIEKLKQHEQPYDVLLMDVQMPVMDGYTATRTIRSRDIEQNEIPIIALTAHALDEYRKNAAEAGMNEYVTKPINPQELVVAIKRCCPEKNLDSPPDS